MSVNWTDRQKQVIELHNRNLLVAAAAGSGKTAVLVERIIQMITRKDNPMDIDRLLVVTFTNAAAAEMRERIGAAIEKALLADPDNVHLQTQVTLLHNAQISTIHSFGLHVIRNHFYQIGLDPAFRIGDEREIDMLKDDVVADLLEDAYEQADADFLTFVKAYGNTKNDKNICEMILSFYEYANSYPWPEEWLKDCAKMYQCDSLEQFNKLPWIQELTSYIRELVSGLKQKMMTAKEMAQKPGGPFHYLEAFDSDLELLEALSDCQDYGALYQMFSELEFSKLSQKRPKCDEDLKKQSKTIRDDMKAQLEKLGKSYFSYSPEEQFAMLQEQRPMMEVLIGLTQEFSLRFAQAKDDKNIIDYGDIEHFALKILVDENTKNPAATAKEYQERFVEIMIDEYQDSNYVQEAMLTAVSRLHQGENNMFMVGDVKQSIYRFRLARPELFMEKYRTYQTVDSGNQRIDLHHNFRSRPEVLTFTNEIFYHIMDSDMGNIIYDDEAALHVGREFEEPQKPTTHMAEVLPICVEDKTAQDKVVHEARVVAAKIREMTNPVTAGAYCPEYRDIVILVHAMKGWSDVFMNVFAEEGIPLISASRTGYFSAVEVQTLLQMLKVLNNPRQDIPLTGVMRSVIGGFTSTELAQIKAAFPALTFHEAVARWNTLTGEDAASIVKEKIADSESVILIHEKVTGFFGFLYRLRDRIPDTPIHELIQVIYQETGYLDYVTALPAGERRRANLDMLVELAISYENTSYQGLFDFVRYIEKMIRLELDYGEAELVSEQENAVRMMTIHKSKGLEFPVVFLCGMGKEFNFQSLNSGLIFHPQYGAGLRWLGKEKRIKKNALARQVFSLLEKREMLGEEQRLLYVALTRAKEKLVLTGIVKEKDLETGKYTGMPLREKEVLPFSQRMDAKCFWDWVLPVIYRGNISCVLDVVGENYVESKNRQHVISTVTQKSKLMDILMQSDDVATAQIEEILNWQYPHETNTLIKQKVSVSEMKHRYMEQQGLEDTEFLHKEQEVVPYIPRFADRVDEENAGALRGTAMHRYLECFDFAQMVDIEDGQKADAQETGSVYRKISALITEQLEEMSQSGRLSDDLRGRLDLKQIERFLLTEAADRMAAADVAGNLYREKPFVMSVPASQVWEGASAKEPVLVQGIVDVFWVEEDGITLLDYKTDAVSQPEELICRYKIQLELYAKALSRVFDNCPIKDILIYSFKFNQAISLNNKE